MCIRDRRNTLGLTFPSCGSGVIEPTSTKPNPIFNIPSTHSACLSNPAANPIGDSKSLPKTLVFYNGFEENNASWTRIEILDLNSTVHFNGFESDPRFKLMKIRNYY